MKKPMEDNVSKPKKKVKTSNIPESSDHSKNEKKRKSKESSKSMAELVDEAVSKTDNPFKTLKTWKYEPSTIPSNSSIAEFLSENTINISNCNDDYSKPLLEFKHAQFPKKLEDALLRFPRPTPIQSVTWPPILNGRDLIGIAATGSGKTLAFGIPAMLHIRNKLSKLNVSGHAKRHIQALIMSPTRELAMQIQEQFEIFGNLMDLTSICLYGGASKGDQARLLREGADIIVATPGRLMDFMNDGQCDISNVGFFVLDEADRMLDLGHVSLISGFEPNIREIAGAIKNKSCQTVMFSATWPASVMKLAERYLKNPVNITVGSKDLSANSKIEQRIEVLDPKEKERRLTALLRDYHKSRKNRIIIFALYKKEAARLELFLKNQGFNAKAIHGDLTQDRRSDAIASFKDGSCPLLIATDVAARGIDIPNVEYVINFTYPLTTEDYCHRIGRTGRAGKTGIAHTFFTVIDKSHSGALINVLKQANQIVPPELMKFGTTVKKKLDSNYGAFTKEIDPNAKATKITFADDDD